MADLDLRGVGTVEGRKIVQADRGEGFGCDLRAFLSQLEKNMGWVL